MEDRFMVCTERTIGSELFWTHPLELLGEWNLVSVCLETVYVSVQDTCIVCAKRIMGLEIILDTLDGTPR
jgi:hypothetical protein